MCKIAHISDIHIRSLSRLSEYKVILQEFIDNCRLDEVDHIFVGGDVYHTKTQNLSPEYIEFMRWFLTEMSLVANVHIILGNHDGNLSNLSRLDAVSPIVNTLANSKIKLYKKSGCYEFEPGYMFCVFSLFDKEGWKDVKPIDGKINIACYHGPVYGAHTESDWMISEGLKVEFFEKFDYALLGDIHRLQFLGVREVEIEIDESDLHKYPDAEIV